MDNNRHTKNICVGTLFVDYWDDDHNEEEVIWRVIESRSGGRDGYVWYVDHVAYPDETPPRAEWEHSSFDEVKTWHAQTRAVLAQRADLQPPTGMQDTAKTLEIYEEVCVACVLFVDHVTHHTHTHTHHRLCIRHSQSLVSTKSSKTTQAPITTTRSVRVTLSTTSESWVTQQRRRRRST